jgi:hypothetical protein
MELTDGVHALPLAFERGDRALTLHAAAVSRTPQAPAGVYDSFEVSPSLGGSRRAGGGVVWRA